MPKNQYSNDFKIIAIKPCEGCHKDYLKVLKKDQIYYLYNDYTIEKETEIISYKPSVPSKLFHQGKLCINISAIAGQNGSGKSSLIELLFMAINNIGVEKELNDDLVLINELSVELYCQIGTYYKIKIVNDDIKVFNYNPNNTINRTPVADFDLNNFFYTIAINYSLYAYNSEEIREDQDDWLEGLFHKNDSYQTPLVINPKRNKGDIDINNENYLVRLRLMANILRPEGGSGFNFRKTTDNLVAVKLQLMVNKNKSRHVLYEIEDPNSSSKKKQKIQKRLSDLTKIEKDKILRKINKVYPFKYKKPRTEREEEATDYLIGKLVSIAVTYKEYKDQKYYSIEDENFDMERIDDFINAILEDSSHIVFKVKQTLNFLKYPYLPYESDNIDVKYLSGKIDEIISKKRGIKPKIEEMIPPPIFNVDILLAPASDFDLHIEDKELVEFRTLSSGERQMIYSISSVIYHLINLESVRRNGNKIKYNFVNIIMEEVELYFHPEMQRCFVKTLLDSIQNIQLKTIKGINLCFVTHSPFILSDIPNANVMFLKVVDKVSQLANREEKTFGANIHDLLADGFFMHNGFCGAFAAEKITETINFLEYHKELKIFQAKYQLLNPNVEDKRKFEEQVLSELYNTFTEKKKEEHFKLIKLIGESVLSVKLLEMYDEVFKTSREEILRSEIARLTKQLNKLD